MTKEIEKFWVITGDDLPQTFIRFYRHFNSLVIALDSKKREPEDRYGIPEGSEFLIEGQSEKPASKIKVPEIPWKHEDGRWVKIKT